MSPVILTAAVVIPWGTMAAFIVKDRMRRRRKPDPWNTDGPIPNERSTYFSPLP